MEANNDAKFHVAHLTEVTSAEYIRHNRS